MASAFRSHGCAMEIKIAPTAQMKHHAVSIANYHHFFISRERIKVLLHYLTNETHKMQTPSFPYTYKTIQVGTHATADYNLLH